MCYACFHVTHMTTMLQIRNVPDKLHRRLKARAAQLRDEELSRLLNRLNTLDDRTRNEIRRSFDRLVNKLLHPPLESLRDEAQRGTAHGLLDALKKLFQLKD